MNKRRRTKRLVLLVGSSTDETNCLLPVSTLAPHPADRRRLESVDWSAACAVGWMEVGEAVVECMGHGRPLVGWMEMGELLAVRVLLHSTTMTAGVPLVRWPLVR